MAEPTPEHRPPPAPDEPPRLVDPLDWRRQLREAVSAGSPWRGPATTAVAAAAVVALGVLALLVWRGATAEPIEVGLPRADTGEGSAPGDTSGGASGVGGDSTTTTAASSVVAHAAGAVQAPGVYRLPAGARVADLVEAAGGVRVDADVDRVNLAAPVVDGERVYVPVLGEAVAPAATNGGGGATSEAGAGPVNINTATAAELETLPGVGPATAEAIIEERTRRGGFASVEELLEVRGIGDAKLAQLRDRVTL